MRLYYFIIVTDCRHGSPHCHQNASCRPSIGDSYHCVCYSGFTGDGLNCSGIQFLNYYYNL